MSSLPTTPAQHPPLRLLERPQRAQPVRRAPVPAPATAWWQRWFSGWR